MAMFAAARIVVYDACVLHPAPLRDLLLRLAERGVVQAKWTDHILDEVFDSIIKRRPELARHRLDRTRQMMNAAIPDCLVTGHEGLAHDINLPKGTIASSYHAPGCAHEPSCNPASVGASARTAIPSTEF